MLSGGIKPGAPPHRLYWFVGDPPPLTGATVTDMNWRWKLLQSGLDNMEWGITACGHLCTCYVKLSLETISTLHWIHQAGNTEQYTHTHVWPSSAAAPDCPVPHLGLSFLWGWATALEFKQVTGVQLTGGGSFPTIINVTPSDRGTAQVLHVRWCRQQGKPAGGRCSLRGSLSKWRLYFALFRNLLCPRDQTGRKLNACIKFHLVPLLNGWGRRSANFNPLALPWACMERLKQEEHTDQPFHVHQWKKVKR